MSLLERLRSTWRRPESLSSAPLDPCDPIKARRYVDHVLDRIRRTDISPDPFFHLFVEDFLPDDLYQALKSHMYFVKHYVKLQRRFQDSKKFVNKRYNLENINEPEVGFIRHIFSNKEVKMAFIEKFYLEPSRELADALIIHEEFEYVYTRARRFQNIHVDIPPKFLSFVFYVPEHEVSAFDEERNATVLYDRTLSECYNARYKANSLCVFVPHFYSYHGFSSTIDRGVLVIFLIHPEVRAKWASARSKNVAPFASLKDEIEAKLTAYPLIEYGRDPARILAEREVCLINAPQGRVMRDDEGRPFPVSGQANRVVRR